MKKNIDHMTFQCDNNYIQKILDEYGCPPDEKNSIIGLIHDLSENDQVLAIYLYGSYARKEPKPYSDVDIAVITQMMDPPPISERDNRIVFIRKN